MFDLIELLSKLHHFYVLELFSYNLERRQYHHCRKAHGRVVTEAHGLEPQSEQPATEKPSTQQ